MVYGIKPSIDSINSSIKPNIDGFKSRIDISHNQIRLTTDDCSDPGDYGDCVQLVSFPYSSGSTDQTLVAEIAIEYEPDCCLAVMTEAFIRWCTLSCFFWSLVPSRHW
jgi:hypothetical protein